MVSWSDLDKAILLTDFGKIAYSVGPVTSMALPVSGLSKMKSLIQVTVRKKGMLQGMVKNQGHIQQTVNITDICRREPGGTVSHKGHVK